MAKPSRPSRVYHTCRIGLALIGTNVNTSFATENDASPGVISDEFHDVTIGDATGTASPRSRSCLTSNDCAMSALARANRRNPGFEYQAMESAVRMSLVSGELS